MPTKVTQKDFEKRLYLRVSRLKRLVELEAPDLILDGEKKLIEKAIRGLEPANLLNALLCLQEGVRLADKEREDFDRRERMT